MKYKVYVDWLTQWGKDYLSHLKQIFQGKLTAGEGVTIDENNVISASSTGDEYMLKENPVGSGSLSMNRKEETTVGDYSVTLGYNCTAVSQYDHAEGNRTTADTSEALWHIGAHAEGSRSVATGDASHAEGSNTIASGIGAHAEGQNNVASGLCSHAEGYGTIRGREHLYNIASGTGSHAEGDSTTASGNNGSHAEGHGTIASGVGSHAEGNYSEASGKYSHAEGYGLAKGHTTASGDYSHAEGNQTTASGQSAHSEGFATVASGLYAHTEGARSTATGDYSHAEGNNTSTAGFQGAHTEGNLSIASREYQHVGGVFNSDNPDALMIIGNGEDNANRSNAFEVLADGRATVGADPVDNMDIATKQFVESYFEFLDNYSEERF